MRDSERTTIPPTGLGADRTVGRQDRMEVPHAHFAGSQFRQRVEAIFESFSALRNDLEQEKRAMQRIWAKREKQIERVLANTVGLHGDVAGIIGGTLPEIAGIELKALAADTTTANEDTDEEASSGVPF